MILRVLLLWVLFCSTAFADRATEIVDKSEAVYSKAGTFSAKFSQVVSTGDFFDDEKTTGILIMGYPKKFRIDTPEQILASDGDSIWSYSAENKQVTIEAVSRSKETVSPTDYLFNLKKNYVLEYDSTEVIEKAHTYRLSLKAKDNNQFVKSMKVFIDQNSFLIRRLIYRDLNDNKITLDFSDWKTSIKTVPELFRFKTPRGVEEVRIP